MKTFSTIACGLIAASVAVSPVYAGTVISLDGGSNSGSNYGNVRKYDVNGLRFQVTAFSYNTKVGSTYSTAVNPTRAYSGQYGEGLGVINTNDNGGSNNQHTIDNQYGYDFLMIVFDQAVNISSAVLNPFSVNGNPLDKDAFVSVTNKTGAFNWNNPVTLALDDTVFGTLNSKGWNVDGATGTSGNGNTVNLMSGVKTGNVWVIGAARSGANGLYFDDKIDGFKLDAINVSPAVPEPATWAMMISGFGIIGASMRRRRRIAVSFSPAL